MNARREALKRARRLRDEFRARGEFFQSDFRDKLPEELRDLESASFQAFVDYIAERVDDESTRERSPDESLLFEGWDLDGEYRLGEGRRVAKRKARLEHMEKMIALDEQNTAAVLKASQRKHEELARLRPYLSGGDRTKEEAIEVFVAEHGGLETDPLEAAGD
jgi:hypothetical protein